MTDGNGKLAAFYEYDAWGNVMTEAEKSGVDNPYRYSTKEWDEKSGLYYFGFRYYSPEMGRWTQRDPAGTVDGLNMYIYAGDEPIGRLDPFGVVWCILGEMITQVLAVGPRDAYRANQLAEEASRVAKTITSDVLCLGDSERDAFRHCYWSCRMARELGVETAMTVGQVHEDCRRNNPPGDRAMDEFNNVMGRLVARGPSDCKGGRLRALEEGLLQTDPGGEPGPRGRYDE